jgi:Holliday junction resolvase-like predicted endonuclease
MDTEILEIKRILKDLALAQKETDARFKETDVRFKETDKRIKAAFDLFEGQWGKLMESLVEGDLINLLNQWGIKTTETSMRRKGSHNGQNFEFDIIAHNGGEIVIIEVKTTLKTQDVKQFIEKLKAAKIYMQEYKDYKIYGAVACLRADSGSEVYAENEKLFVIKATGNSAHILNKKGFVPKGF